MGSPRFSRIAFTALFTLLAGCAAVRDAMPRSAIPLASNGVPLADIVIAPNADENLKFAAGELKEHLDKITGGSFAVVSKPAPGRKQLRVSLSHGPCRKTLYLHALYVVIFLAIGV